MNRKIEDLIEIIIFIYYMINKELIKNGITLHT